MNDVESAGLSLADPKAFADDETLQASLALLLSYPSGNRDEEVLEDPFRFDITRHPDPHLPFGFGGHYCLGAKIAFPSIGLPTHSPSKTLQVSIGSCSWATPVPALWI
jgi:hypothetical protein